MSDELKAQLDSYKNSSEFRLGSRLRQSWVFKFIRRIRLASLRVQIKILPARNPRASGSQVWLLGVWYDDYPQGMPLEFLERATARWQNRPAEGAPFGASLVGRPPDKLAIYTRDANLRIDFMMEESGGQVEIKTQSARRLISLYSARPGVLSVYPNRREIELLPAVGLETAGEEQPSGRYASQAKFSPADLAWLERQQLNPRPLSLNHPEWRGILAAAQQLFDNIYLIPDDLERERAAYYARLIAEASPPSVTIQGFPLSYFHLVRALRKQKPSLPIFVIYHGNYLHVREDYDWNSFKTIKSLHDLGEVARVGFVKWGMAEVMAAAGMRCAPILNLVRRIPEGPAQPMAGGPHVGIWGQPDWSWKKPPYAMLAAMKLLPHVRAHVYNVSQRAQEYGDFLGVPADYHLQGVPQEQVPPTMARMHLNLYVTLTECAPMMPLESLSMGTPCLFGPNTPYFLDHEDLHRWSVVPYPEQAEVIADYASRALEQRLEIVQAYREYAPAYNQRALAALYSFLEYTPD